MLCYFIAGTDTGVGKTLVTLALLEAFKKKYQRVVGLKPVAAGAEWIDDQWQNDDAIALWKNSSVAIPYNRINPVCLQHPMAPHLAAQREGQQVSLEMLNRYYIDEQEQNHDVILLEGAGGWRVPLNSNQWLSDFPIANNLPVILVVGVRLGCINHAVLTKESIVADGLTVAGWIANTLDPTMLGEMDNIQTLLDIFCDIPYLGHIPFLKKNQVSSAQRYLDISLLGRVGENSDRR